MLKKTITFEDFDGNEVTDTFYFNLTKAELVELEVSSKGGFAEMLKRIVASKDGQEIIDNFKKIILMAYGEKSDDGRRFIKNQELRDAFQQTNAFSELFMSLATDADVAAEFMKGVVPADLLESDQPQIPGLVTGKAEPPEDVTKAYVEDKKDFSQMSKEELVEELKRRNM
jgi:hypothetical protein